MFAFVLFLEGILTFISPCILPLLPVYVTYFLGTNQEQKKLSSFMRILSFISGFSLVFILMGMLASYVNQYLLLYRTEIQFITGLLVILAGLKMAGWIRLPSVARFVPTIQYSGNFGSYFSLFLFGIIFAIGWSPCLGTFLGTALLLASQHGTVWMGGGLLFIYSLGLGLPFIICTLLIDSFKGVFNTIKKNYQTIHLISGLLLVFVGVMMMTGWINYLQLFVPR